MMILVRMQSYSKSALRLCAAVCLAVIAMTQNAHALCETSGPLAATYQIGSAAAHDPKILTVDDHQTGLRIGARSFSSGAKKAARELMNNGYHSVAQSVSNIEIHLRNMAVAVDAKQDGKVERLAESSVFRRELAAVRAFLMNDCSIPDLDLALRDTTMAAHIRAGAGGRNGDGLSGGAKPPWADATTLNFAIPALIIITLAVILRYARPLIGLAYSAIYKRQSCFIKCQLELPEHQDPVPGRVVIIGKRGCRFEFNQIADFRLFDQSYFEDTVMIRFPDRSIPARLFNIRDEGVGFFFNTPLTLNKLRVLLEGSQTPPRRQVEVAMPFSQAKRLVDLHRRKMRGAASPGS